MCFWSNRLSEKWAYIFRTIGDSEKWAVMTVAWHHVGTVERSPNIYPFFFFNKKHFELDSFGPRSPINMTNQFHIYGKRGRILRFAVSVATLNELSKQGIIRAESVS